MAAEDGPVVDTDLIPTTTLKSSSRFRFMYFWKSKLVWLWGAKCAWATQRIMSEKSTKELMSTIQKMKHVICRIND